MSFLADWRKLHGALPPLSYALPKDDRWVRFHALPEGKRYAVSPDEERIILERANAIAATVLAADQCWLAQLGSAELGWPQGALRWRQVYGLRAEGEVLHDDVSWPVWAVQVHFKPGGFDELLRDVATERAFRTLWMSSVSGRVFAPYDGGFDVFLESPPTAKSLRVSLGAWLSTRADGL